MALRRRLSAGLPLSNELVIRFQKKTSRVIDQAREDHKDDFIFGNLAVMTTACVVLDPWLCVAAFQRVCSFGYRLPTL